jgi:LysR family transcriptional regulator, carnitine catabolism transcriptional activator
LIIEVFLAVTNVTLRQLRAFVTVARERSFSRAAERLHVSPSAVTIAIRELETEIGLRLFDRSTRSVEATRPAASFLASAERLLGELEHSLDNLRSIAERQRGSVSVAAAASFIGYVLSPAMADLAKDHPGIAIRVIEDTTESLARRVIDADVDFGITSLWRPIEEVDAIPLLRDRLGAMLPPEHPLAQSRAPLNWSAITGLPLASLVVGAGIRSQMDNHPKLAPILQRPLYEASNVSALHSLVARGVGIAIIPWTSARQANGAIMPFRPLQQPVIWRELFLLRRKRRSLSPAALELAKRLIDQLKTLPVCEHLRVNPSLRVDLLDPAAKRARMTGRQWHSRQNGD